MIVISREAAAAAEGDLSVPLPVGFRFLPTDEELVTHYLKKKLQGMDSHVSNIIREIDMLRFEPWDLPVRSLLKSDDENWFFFTRPEYNKHTQKRTTQLGFWKITSKEHAIKARDNKSVIGRKRILTFYRGRVRNSEKTNWVMHEYYIPDANPNAQRDFVLCRIKKNMKKSDENNDVATTCDEGEPSNNASDVENQPVNDMHMEDTRPPDLDYFDRARDLLLASSRSNNDHNAFQPAVAANDQGAKFEEFLSTLIVEPQLSTEPVHQRAQSLQMRCEPQMFYELQSGSSHSGRVTDVILHNQSSRQAASSVNVAPKPQTDRVQLNTGTSAGARGPRQQSGPIIVFRDTSADEYYTEEKTRRRTYAPEKPKEPERPLPAPAPIPAFVPKQQISITRSSIDRKVAQGKDAEKGMEQTQNSTTPSNWKSSFITWQTSPLTSPPSVYIFNTVLGVILFFFCVREVVLYG